MKETLIPYPFVVVDIETTGLDPVQHQIVEICAFKIQNWKIIDRFYSLCWTEKMPEDVYRIHNIKAEDTWGWPSENEVLSKFFNWLENLLIVAHNVSFELGFFENRYQLLFNRKLSNSSLCTRELFNIYKEKHGLDCSSSLRTALDHFCIPYGKLHRAEEDALATSKLLKILLSDEKVLECAKSHLNVNVVSKPIAEKIPNTLK